MQALRAFEAAARTRSLTRAAESLHLTHGAISRQIKQLDSVAAAAARSTGEVANLVDWLDRFVLVLPKVIPGEFTQVFMWAIPADQDPRVGKP